MTMRVTPALAAQKVCTPCTTLFFSSSLCWCSEFSGADALFCTQHPNHRAGVLRGTGQTRARVVRPPRPLPLSPDPLCSHQWKQTRTTMSLRGALLLFPAPWLCCRLRRSFVWCCSRRRKHFEEDEGDFPCARSCHVYRHCGSHSWPLLRVFQ